METSIVYWGYVGIMEKKMESSEVAQPIEAREPCLHTSRNFCTSESTSAQRTSRGNLEHVETPLKSFEDQSAVGPGGAVAPLPGPRTAGGTCTCESHKGFACLV